MPLTQKQEAEINELSKSYGSPQRVVADLPFNFYEFDPINKPDRIGEVCMVVRRLDGSLITARKHHYPPETYRLLTGGIGYDEGIKDALLRETYEETGLDVTIERFLAVIEHRIFAAPHDTQPARAFITFAFLLNEIGGTLQPQDEHEKIADFRFVQPCDLPATAAFLETLGTRHAYPPEKHLLEWGMFRAIAHRTIFTNLCNEAPPK